jgi:hypothetical protein
VNSPTLKGVIIALNEERHIQACIESMAWIDEVVVIDAFSSDATVPLAKQAGAKVIQSRFENFAQQRNAALEVVDADWILFVDADERTPRNLGDEIRRVIVKRPETGWWIPRHNYIFGHRMRATGWYPDYQLRLLKRACAHYDPEKAVHEVVVLEGEAGYLDTAFIHYNYETLQAFVDKQRRYLAYDVSILQDNETSTRFYTPYSQAVRHFFWRFVTLAGWRDGFYGLSLSFLMSVYEWAKYRRLRMLSRPSKRSGNTEKE